MYRCVISVQIGNGKVIEVKESMGVRVEGQRQPVVPEGRIGSNVKREK